MAWEIAIHPAPPRETPIPWESLPFGRIFGQHMALAEYREGRWQQARIEPFHDLTLPPGTSALHYGQALFEGMKAYRRTDGTRFVFRLRDHWERLNRSAARLTMPEVPYELFSELLQTLLHREENFFPPSLQQALYIRPVYFATDPWLGVRPSETYLLLIYVTPVGPYYSGEVRAFVEPELTRAAIGGTGAIKAAGNYAAALLSTKKAQAVGCSVSLWLDATHRELIEEFSTMNAFFVEKGQKLLTPSLERGTILAGITRDTILFLAAKVGLEVEERELSIYEITEGIAQGRITEVFGTGTAATIMPVRALYFAGKFWTLPSENPVAQKLAQAYRALLSGDIPAPAGWIHRV